MVKTFGESEEEEYEEQADEHTPDDGEYWQLANQEFDGETLEEKWDELMSILALPEAERDISIPEPPSPGDGADQFPDVDLEGKSATELLRVVAEILLTQLETQFEIQQNTSPATAIVASGEEVTDNPEEVEELLSSSGEGFATSQVILKAPASNTDSVVIGPSGLDVNRSLELTKGDSVVLDIDLGSQSLFYASEEAGQVLQILALR